MYTNMTSTESCASVRRLDYSSESTNDTSLIAKSTSWNCSSEIGNAAKMENGGIAGMKGNDVIASIAEEQGNPERTDREGKVKIGGIAEGWKDRWTADRKDNERFEDNADNVNARSSKEADNDQQKNEDHVTGSTSNTSHVGAFKAENSINGLANSALTVSRQRKHPAVRPKQDSNLRRTVELAAAQAAKPRDHILQQSEKPHEAGKATVTRCILSTSRFIWLPICQPSRGCRHSEVMDEALVAAAECVRWHLRRNALCDHMVMPMPQETRERIERDVAERKTSVTRKVSQYLKAAFNSSNYEVDLI